VRDPSTTFVMKVVGWSMRDAGIADGDELVVDSGLAADDGRIVVADIGDKNELHIWGVVTRVLRSV
jgi:DNA polymerase V